MNRASILCVATLLSVSASAAAADQDSATPAACASLTWAHTDATEPDASVYLQSATPFGGRYNASAQHQTQPLVVVKAVETALAWAREPAHQFNGRAVLVQVDVITPHHDDPEVNGNRFTVAVDVQRCLEK